MQNRLRSFFGETPVGFAAYVNLNNANNRSTSQLNHSSARYVNKMPLYAAVTYE